MKLSTRGTPISGNLYIFKYKLIRTHTCTYICIYIYISIYCGTLWSITRPSQIIYHQDGCRFFQRAEVQALRPDSSYPLLTWKQNNHMEQNNHVGAYTKIHLIVSCIYTVYIQLHTHIYIYVYIYISTHTYTYTYTHTHIHIYTYISSWLM